MTGHAGGGPLGSRVLASVARARRAEPAIDHCLFAAAVAEVAALAALLAGRPRVAAALLAAGVLGKLALAAAAWLLDSPARPARVAAGLAIRAVALAYVALAACTVTAYAADWPGPWARFLVLDDHGSRPPF